MFAVCRSSGQVSFLDLSQSLSRQLRHKKMPQQNGVSYHESSGWREQELLTHNKPFPTLRFLVTREGSSLVSQVACLGLPSGNGIQAPCPTCPGRLSLLRCERRMLNWGP